MATSYPVRIDTVITLPSAIDNFTPIRAVTVNSLRDAILAIEGTLGVRPASTFGTVAARLDAIEELLLHPIPPGSIIFNGDLSGDALFQTVIGIQDNPIAPIQPSDGYVLTWSATLGVWLPLPAGAIQPGGDGYNALFLQGIPISSATPLNGQVLEYNGGTFMWTPTTFTSTLAGDITGSIGANTLTSIQGILIEVVSLPPPQSSVLVYDTSDMKYDIRQLTLDDLGPAFTITGFSGGSTVEVGVAVVNPTFTASYSSTPSSAQITNTDSIDSPLVLSPPYTTGTVVGSFTAGGSVVTVVTFTLTAVAATTQFANSYIFFEIRDYGGVGTAGATSTVTSSTFPAIPTATLSTADILASEGLFYGGEGVGVTFGPFSPSAQKIYLLLQGASHTFKDANTGFAFPFNAPTTVTFTNQYGVAGITMYLYESQFNLSATYTIEIAS